MIFAHSAKEAACAKVLQAIASYANDVATNPTLTIDERMRTLQWIYKKIPEINRLLIQIKTETIQKGK